MKLSIDGILNSKGEQTKAVSLLVLQNESMQAAINSIGFYRDYKKHYKRKAIVNRRSK